MATFFRNLQYFFASQDFSDGLRTTVGILTPALVCSLLGNLEMGMTLSLGAVGVSVTDTPGPVKHKRNGMLYGALFIFVTTLLTGFARLHPVALGVEITVLSFFFSMLLVYGARAGAVGTAALLLMILQMDKPLAPAQVLPNALLVLAGGLWYMALALAFFRVLPYRAAQQALGENIHAVADFLRIKAEFYRTTTNLDDDYRRLVAQQVTVSEKQDATREIMFKTRRLVQESTRTSRRLVLTFVDMVDLYDHITATYFDNAAIREKFGPTGILEEIAVVIERLADELDAISFAIQTNRTHRGTTDLTAQLEQLKTRIDALAVDEQVGNTLVLKKVLVSLRNLTQRVKDIVKYFHADATIPRVAQAANAREYARFVSPLRFSWEALRDNLTLSSSHFRHAARVMLACVFGLLVSKLFFTGHHSYWVLMTSTLMLKPSFSLTKQRNYQRILGTVVGGAIGIAVLLLLPTHPRVQFGLLVVFMLTAYSFQRRNYVVMVIFLTPYLLILFSFLGLAYFNVIEERVTDTAVGCAIALAASYLLFPNWESQQLRTYMRAVLQANMIYLQQIAQRLSGQPPSLTDYKLARKDVYISSANLGAAFQRMLSEPKSKQRHNSDVHRFVVLNHILSSNMATVAASLENGVPQHARDGLRPVKQALSALQRSAQQLEPAASVAVAPTPAAAPGPVALAPATLTADDRLLLDQLEFLQKVSSDIGRTTEQVLAEEEGNVSKKTPAMVGS
ncbi:FUSC family protein [Hymenobacter sp. BT507]|uniref:FUSC family protein n=1 Tax=Hymenobacter citatus TaxID=2763506 RepID=A0ABR7MLM5_9BACT|nr:FUSC family membrane protein [Hymenobacter citatus]MBC6611986.1 FUSC family protein [Hymenobacter citatus]